MIQKLKTNNSILCTTRNYREVNELAKIKKMKTIVIGKHGGDSKSGKLDASLQRSTGLGKIIDRFKPDLAISFCSPEAARVAFGLGIKHVAFCDSPHAEAVMKLSVPMIQKLLIPWIIPKKEFTKYGIAEKNIIPYKAIDASVIVKSAIKQKPKPKNKKSILIRVEEEHAAYAQKNNHTIQIIQKIADRFPDHTIMVLPRYQSQIVTLREKLGNKVKILGKVIIGNNLLQDIDVFVGSGGTMTAEAALMGIPTISYNAVPNLVQDHLVRKKLITLESNPEKIVSMIGKALSSNNKNLERNAKETLASMEDPYKKLIDTIKKK
jgi:predicted glycosyltransferase